MFSHFDIQLSDAIDFDYTDWHRISFQEIETVFYGEFHVFYPDRTISYIIGHSGLRILQRSFSLDFETENTIIEEISIANAYETDEKYCKARQG